jgi:phytoene dehydrogenase-like protein
MDHDAIIIGSGPNGFAAGIELLRAGMSVKIVEAADTIGGGMRSAELTLPGFVNDICSTIHPLGLASPFFRGVPLAEYGVEFIQPTASVAHPLGDGRVALLLPSLEETAERLGVDGASYRRIFGPLADNWQALTPDLLAPLGVPNHPFLLASFGLKALHSARGFIQNNFKEQSAAAAFAGCAAHSMIPLEAAASASFGLVLGMMVHAVGWPMIRGGSNKLADALAAYFKDLGGEIETGHTVTNVDELSAHRAILFDITPRQIIDIAGHRLPGGYLRRLRKYVYGAGVFKMDWALSEPVPWSNAECALSATVHLGGTFDEVAHSEQLVSEGKVSDSPFIIFVQTSLFDDTRAPAGQHTGWAYCHVPNGWTGDCTQLIEDQIERFAPGFRDTVVARSVWTPADYESHNANYIGGDINGGSAMLSQLFTRPVAAIDPYHIPSTNMYICSSSTPPGGGVHGMCGHHAAKSVVKRVNSEQ